MDDEVHLIRITCRYENFLQGVPLHDQLNYESSMIENIVGSVSDPAGWKTYEHSLEIPVHFFKMEKQADEILERIYQKSVSGWCMIIKMQPTECLIELSFINDDDLLWAKLIWG